MSERWMRAAWTIEGTLAERLVVLRLAFAADEEGRGRIGAAELRKAAASTDIEVAKALERLMRDGVFAGQLLAGGEMDFVLSAAVFRP